MFSTCICLFGFWFWKSEFSGQSSDFLILFGFFRKKSEKIKPDRYCYSKYDYIAYSCGYPQHKETNLHQHKMTFGFHIHDWFSGRSSLNVKPLWKDSPLDINLSHPYILLRKFIFQHLRKYSVFFSYIPPYFLG